MDNPGSDVAPPTRGSDSELACGCGVVSPMKKLEEWLAG